nr:DMT family transporter [Numidum massiliense]
MQTKFVKNQLAIYLLLLLVPLFWGGAFGAAEHVVSEISPFTAATIRFASAGLILLMILVARSEWDARAVHKHWRGLLLMSVTRIFLYNAFFFVGLNITSAVNGSLIVATGPVFMDCCRNLRRLPFVATTVRDGARHCECVDCDGATAAGATE